MAENYNQRWPVIQDILRREGIARQHLTSFDEFLDNGLQSIIQEVGQIEIENAEYPYKIQLGKIKLQQPRMMELDGSITHVTPAEARLRNISYVAPIMMEASVVEDGKTLETRFVHIGDMPVMVKSHACILNTFTDQKLIDHQEDPRDPGGYFIINGSERVVVGLEDLSYNKIIVDAEKVGGKIVHKAKVYSSIIGYRAKLELIMKDDGMIVAKIPGSPVDIPVVTLMRALGLESDKDIAGAVSLVDEIQDHLEGSFEKAGDVPTSKDAIVYISKRIAPGMLEEFQIKRAETILDCGLLPHLGKHPENRKEKEYIVTVNKKITTEFIDKMRKGVRIMGRITRKCFVKKIHENRFKIILTQGMNRQIRRMCEVLGYRVTKLKRVRIMDIHLDTKVGEYRNLNNDEIGQLFIN